jgi:hypothetical protein
LANSFKTFSIFNRLQIGKKSETSDKMRPPKRTRKPPARGASAAKAHRTSKRQKSKSTDPVVPGPSSSGQFQAEGDFAIPGPSRLLQPQPGPSSSGQTSLDSATPGFSGLIPSQPRTSPATLSLSQSGQSHSQENQARVIASTSTCRNLQDATTLPQAASGSYHERVEGPGPSQITAHGSVAQNNYGTYHYLTIPSISNSFLRGSCSSDASPLVSNSPEPEAITSIYDPISSNIPIKMKEKAWRGEFTDLNLLLKSARELANDNNVQGDITLKRKFFNRRK